MDAKNLKKLNRRELLELMVQISEQNEQLEQENEALKGQIENRKLTAREVGSLAKASLDANDFFIAAENAAKLYLENIVRLEQDTSNRSNQLLEETLTECITMRMEAGFPADQLVPASWGAPGSFETELASGAQTISASPAMVPAEVQEVQADEAPSPESALSAEVDQAEAASPEAKPQKKGLFGRKKKSS